MRNMLAFLAAAVIGFICVGGYLGWYHVQRAPAQNGQPSVTVNFDTKKIGEDLREARESVEKRLAERAKANSTPDKPAPASVPAAKETNKTFRDVTDPFRLNAER